MTATKLENKTVLNRFIKARIKNNIITNKKLAIVICVLHAIGFLLLMTLMVYAEYCSQRGSHSDVDMLAIASIISGIIALLAGFVVAMNVFKYLYKKSCVDMNLSLPLTSTQRFFTDYLTGLAIYIIPALCAWLLGDLIGLIGIGLKLNNITEFMPIVNYCGICVILAMILFYTFTVFCIVCCGNIFEAISSALLINGIIPLFIFILGYCICSSNPYGIDEEYFMIREIYSTSPFGCILFIIECFSNEMKDFTSTYYSLWILSMIIYIGIFISATYLLYKKRKAESVSKPYVYKFLYYAITTAILFIIIYTIADFGNSFIASILVSAIVYFLFEVITKRGFKKFHHSVFRFIGTVASIFIIIAISDITDGFGIYKYVPNVSSVSSVSLSYYDYSNYDYSNYGYENNSYSDKNIIKAIIEAQKSTIDNYDNSESNGFIYSDEEIELNNNTVVNYSVYTIDIQYFMKNGNIVSRSYDISYEDFYKIQSAIYTSDEFADKIEKNLSKYIGNIDEYTVKEDKTGTTFNLHINDNEYKELINAYKSDLQNMTEEDFYSAQIIGYLFGYQIRDNFTNTIAFIKEYAPDFNVTGNNFTLSSLAGNSITICTDVINEETIHGRLNKISDKYIVIGRINGYFNGYYSYNSFYYSIGTTTVDADLEKLINVAENVYNDTEIGGMLLIEDKVYYIPVEYKDLVNKVYNKLFTNEYYYDNDGSQYYINSYGQQVYTDIQQ